ncbi:hypothetical protein Aoki45_19830 [Algoriphagus sp. oki45]|uniref:hypothetical protein n=1 Tax=Algoriphagus sp. oki45 TaxID=3067294 RepID=UPI0027F51FBF|nr:hypothetical protein Aoki45_19830 [Algoriphagus sp. oki45]
MEKDFIKDEELLYRAIKPYPNWWKEKENRPSSAAFKDSLGVSVDRDAERNELEIVGAIEERFELKAIVKVKTAYCREIQTYPFPKPLSDNPEHAEIHRTEGIVELTDSQARNLAKSSEIVFQKK